MYNMGRKSYVKYMLHEKYIGIKQMKLGILVCKLYFMY